MVPAGGTCSRARPLPTGSMRRPSLPACSMTLRKGAPVNEGTATRMRESTTMEPLPRVAMEGSILVAWSAAEFPAAASALLARNAARTFAGRRSRISFLMGLRRGLVVAAVEVVEGGGGGVGAAAGWAEVWDALRALV